MFKKSHVRLCTNKNDRNRLTNDYESGTPLKKSEASQEKKKDQAGSGYLDNFFGSFSYMWEKGKEKIIDGKEKIIENIIQKPSEFEEKDTNQVDERSYENISPTSKDPETAMQDPENIKHEEKLNVVSPVPDSTLKASVEEDESPRKDIDKVEAERLHASHGITPEIIPPKSLDRELNFMGQSFNTSDKNLYKLLNEVARRSILSGTVPPLYQLVVENADGHVAIEDQIGLTSILETTTVDSISARQAPGEDASNMNWLFSKYLELGGEFPSGGECAKHLGCTTTAALKWRRLKINRLMDIIPTCNSADGATGADRAAERHDSSRFERDDRNFFHPVGDHYLSWKPGETDARKDPFDTYLQPHAHPNGGAPDLSTVEPKSFYGFANYLGDEVGSIGRTIKVVPSEHGKFRAFLTDPPQGCSGVLDISTCQELMNSHFMYDRDRKTYVLGLCSRDRLEFFKSFDYKGLWNSRIANMEDFPIEYFKVLFKTAHALSYSRKPMMVLMCGDMWGPSAGVALHCNARLMVSGTRLRFDHAQRGSFFEMGAYYRLQNSRMPKTLALYYALTGQPIPAWEMLHYNLGDWMVPDQNGPLLYHHMGNQIDISFLDVFKEQDKYRHRAMLRSVIEQFDRGTEHYAHNSWRRDKASNGLIELNGEMTERVSTIEDEIREVFALPKKMNDPTAAVKVALPKVDDPIAAMEAIIRRLKERAGHQFWAKQALKSIRSASPISIMATYKLIAYHYAETNLSIEEAMHLEFGVLKWMQQKGDFWEGVRRQVHCEEGPGCLWKHENLEELWADVDYEDLCGATLRFWLEDVGKVGGDALGLREIPYKESLFYPRAAPYGMTWENTKTAEKEVKKKMEEYLLDYAQLRGPSHPEVEKSLNIIHKGWRQMSLSKLYDTRAR